MDFKTIEKVTNGSTKRIIPNGHTVIITQVNPYTPVGGVTVVLQNLLKGYDKSNYTIGYLGRFKRKSEKIDSSNATFRLIPNSHLIQLIGYFLPKVKIDYAVRRGVKLVHATKAVAIVGLYPTLSSIEVAERVARVTGVDFYPYLHDTVAEGLECTKFAVRAKLVQSQVFKTAVKIITMSQGMTELYKLLYGITTYPLEHSYPEKINTEPNFNRNKNGFWGGEVYNINDKGFERVQDALSELNTQLTVTSLSPLKVKNSTNLFQTFYPSRHDYIKAVSSHGILILSINWPDECEINEHELATIFPTKTVEYLAMGGPILVHCPEYYFLAKFFEEHKCGVVVSSREPEDILNSIKLLQSQSKSVQEIQRRAIKVMALFELSSIQKKFETILS